jgi:chromosome partitioning protein
MVASDGLIFPVMADMYAIQSLKEVYAELEGAREYNKHLRVYGICITRYMKSVLARDVITQIKAVAEFMGTDVYTSPIRECVAVRESVAVGKSLYEYAPKSTSAKDYDAMVSEFLMRYAKVGDAG